MLLKDIMEIAYSIGQCPQCTPHVFGVSDHAVVLQIQDTCSSSVVPKYNSKKQRYATNTMMRCSPNAIRAVQPCGTRPSRGTRDATQDPCRTDHLRAELFRFGCIVSFCTRPLPAPLRRPCIRWSSSKLVLFPLSSRSLSDARSPNSNWFSTS